MVGESYLKHVILDWGYEAKVKDAKLFWLYIVHEQRL